MTSDFEKQLQLVKQLGFRAVREIKINLAVVTSDKEFNLAGNFFYVKDAPNNEYYIDVKINSSGADPISWTKQTGFLHPFTRLYITTPADQAGTMKILIAAEAPGLFDVVDHRTAASATLNDILEQLEGGTIDGQTGPEFDVGLAAIELLPFQSSRVGFSLQAKSTNTGNIYIGFYDGVLTTGFWFAELQPGQPLMKSNYRGPLWAISDTANQKLGWGFWQ